MLMLRWHRVSRLPITSNGCLGGVSSLLGVVGIGDCYQFSTSPTRVTSISVVKQDLSGIFHLPVMWVVTILVQVLMNV